MASAATDIPSHHTPHIRVVSRTPRLGAGNEVAP